MVRADTSVDARTAFDNQYFTQIQRHYQELERQLRDQSPRNDAQLELFELISRFEQAGQTRKNFCLSQGVSLSTFDLPDYVQSSSSEPVRSV